jgi:8-oxo-dGTP pyrophosphatase MutT (NUDIX family)
MSGDEVEFLLVRTRAGRWTFPKGGIERGLSHAQSAAIEAFEEAGVHGRIEVASFASYVRRRRSKSRAIPVLAFLCEVHRLAKPQESKRERTWFSAEKAKRQLQEGRTPMCAAELAAVVDRAVARVRRLRSADRREANNTYRDALQKVCFESSEIFLPLRSGRSAAGNFLRRFLQPAIAFSLEAQPRKLLPSQTQTINAQPRSNAAADRPRKITAIDSARR